MPQVVVAVVSFIGTVGATTVAAVAGASAATDRDWETNNFVLVLYPH